MAKRKSYRFILYLGAKTFAAFIAALPRSWALALAGLIGGISYRAVGRQREKVFENLKRVYAGEKSESEIRRTAKKVFENLTLTAVDVLQFPKLTWDKVSRFVYAEEAFKTYDALLREGKGIIAITAHIGNWELLAGVFCLKGYPAHVISRRIYYEPFNRWILELRRSVEVKTIDRDESAKKITEQLSRNEILGLLPDQDVDSKKGVFVDFFGRPAYTMTAPVRLALSSGAPIVPSFLIREKGNRYRVVLGEVIRPEVKTTREEAIWRGTCDWMRSMEAIIRRYPEQWAWMHNRWKTQPAAKTQPAPLSHFYPDSLRKVAAS